VWTSSFKPFQEGCSKGFAPWPRIGVAGSSGDA
jgi:hypothetical protein